jgi:hypothetical protein
MNPPKEPKSFIYPRIYFQDDHPKGRFPCGAAFDHGYSRLRIIYPDGSSQFCCGTYWTYPCWAPDAAFSDYLEIRGKHASAFEALRVMREFDEKHGFPPAIFIGEIK